MSARFKSVFESCFRTLKGNQSTFEHRPVFIGASARSRAEKFAAAFFGVPRKVRLLPSDATQAYEPEGKARAGITCFYFRALTERSKQGR